jgi:carboxyl-terminal processing protease
MTNTSPSRDTASNGNRGRAAVLISLGIAIGASISFGHSVLALKDQNPMDAPIAYQEVIALTQVLDRVKRSYVEPVDDKEAWEGAIRGMLQSLDPHSAYLDEDDFEDMNVSTTGQFGGLGIEVNMQDGFVKVVSPLDDTPADAAGMRAGDLVIRIDSKPVKGMTLKDAVDLMRGEPDTDIILTVVRDGEPAPFDVTITRAIIKIQSVKKRMLEDGIGYLRVTQFQSTTGKGLYEALESLETENKGKLKGVVLDLRNNPGGVLTASVDVAGMFLEEKLVVYIQGREESTRRDYFDRKADRLNGAPVVVLVNEGSASASEIVAGALQDHKRALIMGRQTFGKGSVQSIYQISENTAFKLTTARYYTPSGRSIQAEGIKPDIEIPRAKIETLDTSSFRRLREKDLANSLENKDKKITDEEKKDQEKQAFSSVKGEKPAEKPEKELSLAEKDYELYEALNLLKGAIFMHSRR